MSFFRFPHTPHIAWLGSGEPRDDKVLTSREVDEFLSGSVVVEEKLDGANIGFSRQDGKTMAQNRGQYLEQPYRGQFSRMSEWLALHEEALMRLAENHILFGEWCAAKHAIAYDGLPGWFVVFDVYDRRSGLFLSTNRRNEIGASLGFPVVPRIYSGHLSLQELKDLLVTATSCFRIGWPEGFVVRKESQDWLEGRAKLVRADFLQAIGPHWSSSKIIWNRVAYGAE